MTLLLIDYDLWFTFCVLVLSDLAHLTGYTYNQINIWIFCIIEPIAFLWLLIAYWCKAREKSQFKMALEVANARIAVLTCKELVL